jgi:hypothetical protein
MDEQVEFLAPSVVALAGTSRREPPTGQPDPEPRAIETKPYLPPFDVLLLGLGIRAQDMEAPSVAVSAPFLRFMLGELARGAPFDAPWYAAQYPDLGEASAAGGPEWLHEHFVTQGYFEGRLPHEPTLDADWYFRHYRDVWATYSQRLQEALRDHFATQGVAEGRVGTPQNADAADRWIEAARRLGPAVMRQVSAPAEPSPESESPESEAPECGPSAAPPISEQLLMRDFESLGWNCEFGLVQRHFNVEPISLLAFATIPFDQLCTTLSTRFDTLGRPEATKIAVHDHEYCVMDATHAFSKHTWIYQGATDPDELLKRESRKLNFLKSKLVRELVTAGKIFVYKLSPGLTEAQVSELYFELLSYGDNMMLWVDVEDEFHRSGDIELLFGRLYKGYVDKFSPAEAASAGISYSAWFEVCAKAHRLWRKPSAARSRQG